MRRETQLLFLVVAGLVLTCAAPRSVRGAQDPLFTRANQAFNEGRFQEAIDSYETLLRSNQGSAPLFYDLGNAWFRLGNFGKAILNYERALALDPHHPETLANLRLARDEARALELPKTMIERYLDTGTPSRYLIAASIAIWLALFAAARLFFLHRRSARIVTLIILSLGVSAGALFTVYTMETGNNGRALAIITGKGVEARLATADNAKGVLSLPPGSQIKILSERGDWIYAALPNELRGWIPANSSERVRL